MSLMPRIWQPARLQLLGEVDVVVERIFRAVGVEDVAGVADRAFGELAGFDHRVDGDAHVLDPVQAVEDAEQIDAACGGLATKKLTTLSG